MLCIQRKSGQSLQVGDNVKIIFKTIGAGRVKLIIDAPKDVRVLRGELVGMEARKAG